MNIFIIALCISDISSFLALDVVTDSFGNIANESVNFIKNSAIKVLSGIIQPAMDTMIGVLSANKNDANARLVKVWIRLDVKVTLLENGSKNYEKMKDKVNENGMAKDSEKKDEVNEKEKENEREKGNEEEKGGDGKSKENLDETTDNDRKGETGNEINERVDNKDAELKGLQEANNINDTTKNEQHENKVNMTEPQTDTGIASTQINEGEDKNANSENGEETKEDEPISTEKPATEDENIIYKSEFYTCSTPKELLNSFTESLGGAKEEETGQAQKVIDENGTERIYKKISVPNVAGSGSVILEMEFGSANKMEQNPSTKPNE